MGRFDFCNAWICFFCWIGYRISHYFLKKCLINHVFQDQLLLGWWPSFVWKFSWIPKKNTLTAPSYLPNLLGFTPLLFTQTGWISHPLPPFSCAKPTNNPSFRWESHHFPQKIQKNRTCEAGDFQIPTPKISLHGTHPTNLPPGHPGCHKKIQRGAPFWHPAVFSATIKVNLQWWLDTW